jgi:hypothetical protein
MLDLQPPRHTSTPPIRVGLVNVEIGMDKHYFEVRQWLDDRPRGQTPQLAGKAAAQELRFKNAAT